MSDVVLGSHEVVRHVFPDDQEREEFLQRVSKDWYNPDYHVYLWLYVPRNPFFGFVWLFYCFFFDGCWVYVDGMLRGFGLFHAVLLFSGIVCSFLNFVGYFLDFCLAMCFKVSAS